jgi:hypothetical protein
MGQLQVPGLDVVKTALEAAMVRAQETAAAWVRLFNDLSAKSDMCNPMTAGSPTAGSQMGSQRRQAVTDAGRPTATIGAGNWLIRRRPATVHDGPIAPCKRQVSGSNPLTGSRIPNDHPDFVPSACQIGPTSRCSWTVPARPEQP